MLSRGLLYFCLLFCTLAQAEVETIIPANAAEQLHWGIRYWHIAYENPDNTGINIPFMAEGLSGYGVPVDVSVEGFADLSYLTPEHFYLRFNRPQTNVDVDPSHDLKDWRGLDQQDLMYIYQDQAVVNELLLESQSKESFTEEDAALTYAELDINRYVQNKIEFQVWHRDYGNIY